MIQNGKVKSHSGEGAFWGNVIAFAVCYLLFVGCLYALGFWTLESAGIPGLIFMVLAVLAFAIPQNIIGRSDTLVENDARIHAEHTAVQHRGH